MKAKNKTIQLPKENMNGFPYNLVAWKSFKQKGKTDEFYFPKKFYMAKKKRHQCSKRENLKKISN